MPLLPRTEGSPAGLRKRPVVKRKFRHITQEEIAAVEIDSSDPIEQEINRLTRQLVESYVQSFEDFDHFAILNQPGSCPIEQAAEETAIIVLELYARSVDLPDSPADWRTIIKHTPFG